MLPDPIRAESALPWEADLTVQSAEPGLPGVSVVIPIYNSAAFLEKTLRSLLCQDLSGVELILVDGASTDATPQIVDHYRDMFATVVMEPDKGQSDAINKGFERAGQPILYWLNGDDIILPNTLVAVRRMFRDHPGTEVVVGDAYMTELDFTPINHFRFGPEKLTFDHLLDYARHHLIQPSVFFSRTAWQAAGPVRLDHHYAMDADLFLGMAARFPFRHLPLDIAYSVYHPGCKTREKRAESITELALVQARHGGFDQARKTLDILVGLFNRAEEAATPQAGPTPNETVLHGQLQALRASVEKNKAMLLDLDQKAVG
ncbi:glycosyltransferase [Sedimentitalea nanhaiensis]|uniref:Glycosyl transferase family 2 n=1 Tax=Sedimentitalea nanhaiensis TaxID=999627 RepID=A0A1I7E1V5_9RHOB|nr:glycosyltransferase [Sedimentitalea nanhaiensis]SFU17884.1 Glycosyl transferase family 2 [Sedimentitalea nanhaiensis]